MNYKVGSSVNVKCDKGWKVGVIEKIIGSFMFVNIQGYKNLKKVNMDYVNMYF